MKLQFEPQPEFKCRYCGKAESNHRGTDKACPPFPFGEGVFHKFESSGKMTIKSKRAIEAYHAEEKRKADRAENERLEKSKVRNLTLEEVITKTVEIISEKTGLGVVVKRDRDHSAEIHITNLGGRVYLGYTSVTKTHMGTYIVGGTSAGCFMAFGDNSIGAVLHDDFEALETFANQEKV